MLKTEKDPIWNNLLWWIKCCLIKFEKKKRKSAMEKDLFLIACSFVNSSSTISNTIAVENTSFAYM